MRDLQKDLEIIRATTPGEWELLPAVCGPEGQGVYQKESGGCICEVGDPYPRGDNHPQENMTFIVEAHNGGWEEAIQRAMAAEARVKELEAQCAAMREALEELVTAPPVFTDERLDYVEIQVAKASLADAEKALSSSAGRDLLERMKKLEAVAGAAKACFQDAQDDGEVELETISRLEEAIIALEGGGPA